MLQVLGGGTLQAHDSPEHVIEALSARIEAVGPRPDLLWRRATEYRALGDLSRAEKDLRAAIRRRSGFTQATLDLSRVQLAQENPRAALRTIRRELRRQQATGADAGTLMLHAEVLAAVGRTAEAVAECDRALQQDGVSNPEWYLARCHLQYRLGRFQEAADGLRRAVDLTGNAVLEAEWLDALIDAGRFDDARPHIAEQLALSRCQASWLVRRGRINAGQGRVAEAHADFLAAITELTGRLAASRPDFTLLAERGLAYAALGDLEQARADLARARACGADEWTLHRLERAVPADGPDLDLGP